MGLATGGGTNVGVQVVNAPNATGPQQDPNAVVKSVGPANNTLPSTEKAAEAPVQANDITKAPEPQPVQQADSKKPKSPKVDQSEESSSKKKKKKGLDKLNPF